jgi:hypothetical protein
MVVPDEQMRGRRDWSGLLKMKWDGENGKLVG